MVAHDQTIPQIHHPNHRSNVPDKKESILYVVSSYAAFHGCCPYWNDYFHGKIFKSDEYDGSSSPNGPHRHRTYVYLLKPILP